MYKKRRFFLLSTVVQPKFYLPQLFFPFLPSFHFISLFLSRSLFSFFLLLLSRLCPPFQCLFISFLFLLILSVLLLFTLERSRAEALAIVHLETSRYFKISVLSFQIPACHVCNVPNKIYVIFGSAHRVLSEVSVHRYLCSPSADVSWLSHCMHARCVSACTTLDEHSGVCKRESAQIAEVLEVEVGGQETANMSTCTSVNLTSILHAEGADTLLDLIPSTLHFLHCLYVAVFHQVDKEVLRLFCLQ
mmetsp:Transcript_43808/g.114250  ORF Transcript_43808/g.114250 Transcript_43808/m.114250 type:complete len:247 (+) Transcript_43808:948-1688(+)